MTRTGADRSKTRRYVSAAVAVVVTLGAVIVAFALLVSRCVVGEPGDPAPFRPGSAQARYCESDGGWLRLAGPDVVGGAVLLVSLVLLLLRELSTAARVALVLAPAAAALAVPVVVLSLPD